MITAVFDKNQDCVYAIDKLWQWDYGRKLRIQGLSLPDAIEIQFSLQETGGEATPRIGLTRDGVTDVVIPDFIAEGDGATANYDAYAFIYLTDDTSGRTIKKIKMRVQARSKPEGYGGGGSTTMADILKAVNEAIASGGVSDEQIKAAVESYLDANPIEEQDPTVPGWAKAETKPTYTASEVGADPVGTADAKVSAHNTATDAHNDIRLLIDGLTTRLNALADSDDTTLDQMSEVVAYIKSNKSLIDAITTNKVSVSDIIDNLTTNVSNKPLSAAQGVALKALIDAIVVPEKLPNPNALTIKQGDAEVSYDGSGAVTVTIPEGSDGKSAYQYAVEGGYTGTEEEFSAKLAAELPDTLPNPNALTFTGAVTGRYDGSAPVSVDIPSGGADCTISVDVLASGKVVQGSEEPVDTGVTLGMLKEYKMFILSVSGASNVNLHNWYTRLGNLCLSRVNNARAQTILYEFLNAEKTVLMPMIGALGNHGVYKTFESSAFSYGVYGEAAFPYCIYNLAGLNDNTTVITYPVISDTVDVNWSILGVVK